MPKREKKQKGLGAVEVHESSRIEKSREQVGGGETVENLYLVRRKMIKKAEVL